MIQRRPGPWIAAAGGVLVGSVLLALSIGSVSISPIDSLRVLLDHLTPFSVDTDPRADAIVWNIRMPRIVVAACVGALLGVAATVLQGLTRNPLADPQLLGISAFGSVGALIGFWAGYATVGPEVAIAGGALTGTLGAVIVGRRQMRIGGTPSRLILVGLAIGLAVSALVAAASIAIHDPRIPDVTFWFFGGLAAATWTSAVWIAAVAVVVLIGAIPLASRLDMMALGPASARHAGLDVDKLVTAALLAVGFGVGATVGTAGVVAFVGLVAARFVVRSLGSFHRFTLPASAVTGAVVLVVADTLGRIAGRGFEVPVGLVTTVFGGIYLAWLVATSRVRL